MKFIASVLVPLLFLWLFSGCGSSGLQDKEVRGKVSEILNAKSMIELQASKGVFGGEEKALYRVGEGDLAWLKVGREIRGVPTMDGETLKLMQIFPASNQEESRMYVMNQKLRNDTVDRGQQAFREVGEFLPYFALFDQDGQIMDHDSCTGKFTVFTFIFTRCRAPEMCPVTTARMGTLLTEIKDNGLQDAQLVSITLDPEFDTPGILKTYAGGFGVDDPQYRFLTGSLQAIHDLKKQLGILTHRDPEMLIQHSMSTTLVGPDLKILHRVPGATWKVSEFLDKIRSNQQYSPIPPSQ